MLCLFILNLISEDLLHFSYPFIKDEKFKSDPFVHLTEDLILNDAIQRNGGAFRIVLNSLLFLIEAKNNRSVNLNVHVNELGQDYQLLKILSMFMFGQNPSKSQVHIEFASLNEDLDIGGNKITFIQHRPAI